MISKGYRRKTRKLFSKDFKKHGLPNVTKYIHQYKIGDLVDCKVDPSVVKGMPHKYYHGRTGRVYNINVRAVGVLFNRRIGGKIVRKPLNVRIEHLCPSRSNEQTKRNNLLYSAQKEEAKEKNIEFRPNMPKPAGPRKAFTVSTAEKKPIEVVFKAPSKIY